MDTVIEASGVQPIGGGRFLVAHDKDAPLCVVDLATRRAGRPPLRQPEASPRRRTAARSGRAWRATATGTST